LTYTPDLGIGEQSLWPVNVTTDEKLNDDINSYSYGLINQALQFGPTRFYFNMQHTYQGRFTQPQIDTEYGKTIANRLSFNQYTGLINGISYRGSTSIDLRTAQGQGLKDIDHTRFDDLNNLFDMTLIKNVYFSEDYIYSIRYSQPLTSNMIFNYSIADLIFPIINAKSKFTFRTVWNQSFQDPRSSNLTFINNFDFELGKNWKFHISTRSLNEKIYLYSQSLANAYQVADTTGEYQHRNFFTDLLNSINIFQPSKMQDSYFKLKEANISVEHDLHCWQMSFGYSLNQKYYNYGTTTQYPYLEHSFWLKLI